MITRKIVDLISYHQQLNLQESIDEETVKESNSSLGTQTSVLEFRLALENNSPGICSLCDGNENVATTFPEPKCLLPNSDGMYKIVEESRKGTSDVNFPASKSSQDIFIQTDPKPEKRRHSSLDKYPHKHTNVEEIMKLEKGRSSPVDEVGKHSTHVWKNIKIEKKTAVPHHGTKTDTPHILPDFEKKNGFLPFKTSTKISIPEKSFEKKIQSLHPYKHPTVEESMELAEKDRSSPADGACKCYTHVLQNMEIEKETIVPHHGTKIDSTNFQQSFENKNRSPPFKTRTKISLPDKKFEMKTQSLHPHKHPNVEDHMELDEKNRSSPVHGTGKHDTRFRQNIEIEKETVVPHHGTKIGSTNFQRSFENKNRSLPFKTRTKIFLPEESFEKETRFLYPHKHPNIEEQMELDEKDRSSPDRAGKNNSPVHQNLEIERKTVISHHGIKVDSTHTQQSFEKKIRSLPVGKIRPNISHSEQRFEKRTRSLPISKLNVKSSPFFSLKEESGDCFNVITYGCLFVFGCNRKVPSHLVGKMDAKFVLRRRIRGNGLKEAFSCVRSGDNPVSVSPAKHVISYPVTSNTCIDVAFLHDPLTDMFQVGRHDKSPIDFTVDDMNPEGKARHGVSRFACRILVRRDGNHEARVYAAAFDSSSTIFLGEESIPCKYRGQMDGFTTNGVLMMQPGEDGPGVWREVSVGGYIYPLRQLSKSDASNRPRLTDESNILRDGTMIDLCGVTLLWRTPEGLKNTPNDEYLSRLVSTFHRSAPECQLLKADTNLFSKWAVKKAFTYLSCGHVIGLNLLKAPHNLQGWSCPICRVIGPIAELVIGAETGFYLDGGVPLFAFKPCGHVTTHKTVLYWSAVTIPHHRSIQYSLCPFCGEKLNLISKYVKLIFPS